MFDYLRISIRFEYSLFGFIYPISPNTIFVWIFSTLVRISVQIFWIEFRYVFRYRVKCPSLPKIIKPQITLKSQASYAYERYYKFIEKAVNNIYNSFLNV